MHQNEGREIQLFVLALGNSSLNPGIHILEHHGIFLGSQAFPELLRAASTEHPCLRTWTRS